MTASKIERDVDTYMKYISTAAHRTGEANQTFSVYKLKNDLRYTKVNTSVKEPPHR